MIKPQIYFNDNLFSDICLYLRPGGSRLYPHDLAAMHARWQVIRPRFASLLYQAPKACCTSSDKVPGFEHTCNITSHFPSFQDRRRAMQERSM